MNQIKASWKILVDTKSIELVDMIIYNILRNKELNRGFYPKGKNIQGNDPWFKLNKAKLTLRAYLRVARTRPKRGQALATRFGIPQEELFSKLEEALK